MPGLGRISTPVPHPVLVTSWRTGKFFETSGSDPQPGCPPGPPLAADNRQIVGIHVGVVAEQQGDVKLKAAAVRAAERRIGPVLQVVRLALQQAGVGGAVLEQQVRGGLEDVGRCDEIVLAGGEQVGPGVGRSR